MPRTCTICIHSQRAEIDAALLAGEPFRNIASRYGTSTTALQRHKAEHMPQAMTQAHEVEQVAQADDLLSQVQALRNKAMGLLLAAEKAGDLRTALLGVREARACIELLLEVEGRINRAPTNILVLPEWVQLRAEIVQVLQPYPEARTAVATALARIHTDAR